MDTTHNGTLQLDRLDLVEALGHLSALTDRTGHKPILAHVYAQAKGDKLSLAATDYDAALELSLPCEGQAGSFLIPAQQVAKALRSWRGSQVTINVTDEAITIAGAGAQMPLPVVDPGLYPALDNAPLPERFTMHARGLARALETSVPFCNKNETRRNLMGVHVVARKDDVRFEVTDGHRLTRRDTFAQVAGKAAHGQCIMPASALTLWQRATKGQVGEVAVAWGDTRFRFTLGDTTLSARLIEAQFPTVDSVIPAKARHAAATDLAGLASAVKAVCAMSADSIKPVAVRFDAAGIVLASEPCEHGQIVQTLAARYRGEPVRTGFNGAYMLDFLKLAKGGQVAIGATEPAAATRWSLSDDPDLVLVLMPLRVQFDVPSGSIPAPQAAPKPKAQPRPKVEAPASPPAPVTPPVPVEAPQRAAACEAQTSAIARIGKLGESRLFSIERARSQARPAVREIPSLRKPPAPPVVAAPAPEPQAPAPEPTPEPSPRSAFRPYPQAQPAQALKTKGKRKSPLTAEQRSEIARKAVETRRRNAAMQAAG